MNVDRGKTSFSEEEIQELRDRLAARKAYEEWSWKQLEKETGIPSGTLSNWVPNKYPGDNAAVAAKVHRYFLTEEARREAELAVAIVPGFQHTKTARRITGVLQLAHTGEMAMIVGDPGLGKTSALRQYEANTPNCGLATMGPHTKTAGGALLQICKAVGATTRKGGSRQTLVNIIADRLQGVRYLLMVDEAQHLNDEALEQIRFLHDTLGIGVVYAGSPYVLTRVTGQAKRSEYAQIASRVAFQHVIEEPDPEDIAVMCAAWGVTSAREREFLGRIAAQEGAIRTMTQVLRTATLLAQAGGEDRCLSHLQEALQHRRRTPKH